MCVDPRDDGRAFGRMKGFGLETLVVLAMVITLALSAGQAHAWEQSWGHVYSKYCENDPSCVLYLSFDEGSGTIAYDNSSQGNKGSLVLALHTDDTEDSATYSGSFGNIANAYDEDWGTYAERSVLALDTAYLDQVYNLPSGINSSETNITVTWKYGVGNQLNNGPYDFFALQVWNYSSSTWVTVRNHSSADVALNTQYTDTVNIPPADYGITTEFKTRHITTAVLGGSSAWQDYEEKIEYYHRPVWTQGKFGNAIAFDNDNVSINFSTTLNNFTLMLWAKGIDKHSDIFNYGNGTIRLSRTGYKYNATIKASDGSEYSITANVSSNGWHFLTLRYNSSFLEFLIDNSVTNYTTTPDGLYAGTTGTNINISNYGEVDEVMLFNRSSEKISEIYRTGWLYVSLKDEATFQPINESLTVEIRNQSTFELIDSKQSSNGSAIFTTPGGDYAVRAGLDSSSSYPYLRQVFKSLNFPNVSEISVTLYLASNETTTIFDVFNKIDYSNTFPSKDTTLKLMKYINSTLEDVHETYFDFNDQASAWLILTDKYQLAVHNKASDEERVLGRFNPDPDGSVDIILTALTLNKTVQDWLNYGYSTDNSTGMIRFDWNSSLPVKLAEFWVNLTNSTLIYYSNSTADAGSFIYYANNSQNYIVRYRVETLDGHVFDPIRYAIFAPNEYIKKYWEIFPRKPGWEWLYTAVSIAFIMFVLLGFGRNRAHASVGIAAAFAMFFYYINWLNITRLALAMVVIIAIAAFIERGRREVD